MFNREEKQGDLAEQLESVAYVLCGDQPISLQKFYQIFQAKGVSTMQLHPITKQLKRLTFFLVFKLISDNTHFQQVIKSVFV